MLNTQQFPSISADEFDQLVVSDGPMVGLYISRKCCGVTGPARREFRLAAQKFKHIIGFFEVDADAEKALVSRLNVKAVPTLLVLASGIELAAVLGFHSSDELQKKLWSIIPDRS